uniref:Toll-like receptor 4 n=1 Tax=Otus sunia TaxID=257818 RepID=A0A8C8AT78_9STRI
RFFDRLQLRGNLENVENFLVHLGNHGVFGSVKIQILCPSSRFWVLDLSHNRISGFSISEFIYLPDLQVLNLSHNLITELDFSVFIFNEDLEYLDLSHNNILKVYCQTLAYLRHLDLSFNNFTALPICQEFGNMFHLEYLGLNL